MSRDWWEDAFIMDIPIEPPFQDLLEPTRMVDSPPGKNQRKGENMSATGEAFKVRMVILDSDHLPRMDNGDYRYSVDVVEEFSEALEKFVMEWVTTGPGKDYVRSYSDSYDPMKDPEISVMNVPWNG